MTKNTQPEPLPDKERTMFDRLVDEFLVPAEQILQKDKLLVPIAFRLTKGDEVTIAALQPEDENTDTATHIQAYRELLNETSAGDMACLLAYDIMLREEPGFSDGISIELESKSGQRVHLVIPYRFKGIFMKLELGPTLRVEPQDEKIYKG